MKTMSHSLDSLLLRASRKYRVFLWWLNVLLVLGIVLSALVIVENSYQRRNLVNQLYQLKAAEVDMDIEWGQLLLEQNAWGSYSRIEPLVTEKLNMQIPRSEQVKIVSQ